MRELMEQLGPAMKGVEAVVEIDSNDWVVEVAGPRLVTIERQEALGVATVSMSVGRPADGDRIRIYETALVYNSLWRQSPGVRMSMAGEHEELRLSVELPTPDLQLETLVGALASVLEKGAAWSEYVRGDQTGIPPTSSVISG
jgi:hypothetical protein